MTSTMSSCSPTSDGLGRSLIRIRKRPLHFGIVLHRLKMTHNLDLGSINESLDQDAMLNYLGGLTEYLCSLVPNNYLEILEFLEISVLNPSGLQETIYKQILAEKKSGYTEKTAYTLQLVSGAMELHKKKLDFQMVCHHGRSDWLSRKQRRGIDGVQLLHPVLPIQDKDFSSHHLEVRIPDFVHEVQR